MKVEILCGENIEEVMTALNVEFEITYSGDMYKVAEIDKHDIKVLEESPADLWENAWFRYAKGSNLGIPFDCFDINGHSIIAWGGRNRENLHDYWNDESDEEKEAYHYSFKEYENTLMPYKYNNLADYLSTELNVSTEKNVCAVLTDMAKYNGKTMKWLLENLWV